MSKYLSRKALLFKRSMLLGAVVLLILPRGLVSLLARRLPLFRERYYRE